jgi:hypothetical protein
VVCSCFFDKVLYFDIILVCACHSSIEVRSKMELLRLQDVQLGIQERVFKDTGVGSLILGLICIASAVGIFLWYKFGDAPLALLIFSGGFTALLSLVFFSIFAKALRKDNWLVAIGPGRILIKFRSYQNIHFSSKDKQVVVLEYSQIQSAHITKQKMTYNSLRRNKPRTEFHTYLDLTTTCDNLHQLKERLKYERTLKPFRKVGICTVSSRTEHWPVTVEGDNTIRIEWRSPHSFVLPSVKKAIDLLERQNVRIQALEKEVKDYTQKDSLDPKEIDGKILELAEKGKIIAATRLAKKAYNYQTTEAKKFVESLLE